MNNDINDNNEFAEFSNDDTSQSSDNESFDGSVETNTSETPETTTFQASDSVELEGDTKILCAVCHLGNVLASFTFLTGFISLIIYLIRTDSADKVVSFHAKQSFILFLLWLGSSIVLSIIGFIFSFITIGFGVCLFVPIAMLYWLAFLGYTIYVSVVVFMGKNYRIPIIADWADSFGQ